MNGRVAKEGGDAHSWTSPDDWDHFKGLVARHKLLVMDIDTYKAIQPEPEADRLRVVVTDRSEDVQTGVPGQLEFVSGEPQEIVKDMESKGYDKMLLVGRRINAHFLQAGLVHEMWVTIEPVVFGGGVPLLDVRGLDLNLQLKSVEQLNSQGTLLLNYAVDRSSRKA